MPVERGFFSSELMVDGKTGEGCVRLATFAADRTVWSMGGAFDTITL
ncbi:MAG: hypothetical protein AAFW98_20615 [Pseudomonadota bacterium]